MTNTKPNFKPGDTLPNGATVIAFARSKSRLEPPMDDVRLVVLAVWKDSEYVCWRLDEGGNAYWGHYYPKDLVAATKDFEERTR